MLKYICCCLHLCCGSHFANLQEIEGFTTLVTLFAFFSSMTISGFVGAMSSTLQATFGFSALQATVVCSTVYTITKMICSSK
ncbi:hypothetical protein TrRE_jg299 [Triparma retinervis]|uniref:Uncharacterized protein n=1 Tax=Triparma retinervis TaxID=2557542 RepID=A0A9W7DQH4_9STRA|nr:hypothetical protein TrRE_jg299 [Triparma retinervis]